MAYRRVGALLALLTLALSACSAAEGDDDRVEIVAGVYPVAWIAERVAGEHARVESLASPGVEPHDLELGVGQVADVTAADLVLRVPGLQPALDEAAEGNPDADLAVTAVPTPNAPSFRPEDPHFWLEPYLVADVADAVAERLADLDPGHRDDYLAGAADVRGEMQRLDLEYGDRLADCERSTVVVSHDAYGYLDRYGLTFEPIAGLSPAAEPTAADLARLERLIEAEGVTTVFTEPLAGARLAGTLAADTGVETAVLDPIETEPETGDYLAAMRANLEALASANGCR